MADTNENVVTMLICVNRVKIALEIGYSWATSKYSKQNLILKLKS